MRVAELVGCSCQTRHCFYVLYIYIPEASRGVQWRSLSSVGASIGDPFEGVIIICMHYIHLWYMTILETYVMRLLPLPSNHLTIPSKNACMFT